MGSYLDKMQKAELVWREITEGLGFGNAVIKLHVG